MKINKIIFFTLIGLCGKGHGAQAPVQSLLYPDAALKQKEKKHFDEERKIARMIRRAVLADRKKAQKRFAVERKQARIIKAAEKITGSE